MIKAKYFQQPDDIPLHEREGYTSVGDGTCTSDLWAHVIVTQMQDQLSLWRALQPRPDTRPRWQKVWHWIRGRPYYIRRWWHDRLFPECGEY